MQQCLGGFKQVEMWEDYYCTTLSKGHQVRSSSTSGDAKERERENLVWGAKLCKWTLPALYVFLCCCCIAVCRLSSDTQDGPALRKQFKQIHQPQRKKLDDDKVAKLVSSGFWKDKSRRERDREKTAFCLVFLLVCSEGHSISTDATIITTTTTHSLTLFECLNFV